MRIADSKLDRPIRNPKSAIRNNLVFDFTVDATSGCARSGTLELPHGTVSTPCFMPVGTQGTVRALSPNDLRAAGATLVLANTYHLHVRPGEQVVAQLGALHRFMAWDRPLLTDSGGFQVFSLEGLRTVSEDGVEFRSHLDGSLHMFTPESVMEIERNLGADVIMQFDHVIPGQSEESVARDASERSVRWLVRCVAALEGLRAGGPPPKTTITASPALPGTTFPLPAPSHPQALFPIVQGGIHESLRRDAARVIRDLGDWSGFGIGGLSVGEAKPDMYRILEVVDGELPRDRPRYLMGVGFPEDLIEGVLRGIDLFDCVAPTRMGRNGAAFTRDGRLNIKRAEFRTDPRPLDDDCDCAACRRFSRGYLRHLFVSDEMLGLRLLSLHNVHFLVRLMRDARDAIRGGTIGAWSREWLARYHSRPVTTA